MVDISAQQIIEQLKNGEKSTLAIDRNIILNWVSGALSEKKITNLQALAFLSANVLVHPNSKGDEGDYLHRVVKLYNAKDISQICAADDLNFGSTGKFDLLRTIFNNGSRNNKEVLNALKCERFTQDIMVGSSGSWMGEGIYLPQAITKDELDALPRCDKATGAGKRSEKLSCGTEKSTYAMLDIDDFFPMFLEKRQNGNMTESQCVMLLCFILHGLETRKNGESYIDHPMAVAEMVQRHGDRVFNGRKDLTMRATMIALNHDIGESTNIHLREHLEQLLSPETASDIQTMHLQDGEGYFDYIARIAKDPVTAFVKICDICHNTDGHKKTILKQNFVYRLAAAYLRASIEHPNETKNKTVGEWAVNNNIVGSINDFDKIVNIAKKSYTGDGSEIDLRLSQPVNEKYLSQIRSPEYANPCRETGIQLQPVASILFGRGY